MTGDPMLLKMGDKTYRLYTALAPEMKEKLESFSAEFFSSLAALPTQEQRLAIGWATLAFMYLKAEEALYQTYETLRGLGDRAAFRLPPSALLEHSDDGLDDFDEED